MIFKEDFLLPFYVRKSIVHTFGQFFSSGFDPLRNLIRVFFVQIPNWQFICATTFKPI
jgi:hypothetical protein